jgi:hypothetical protein
VVRFDHAVVPATLADTGPGRQFAALLPLTLELRDAMGQAKSGPLPARIDATGSGRVHDPDAGGIYYLLDVRRWPSSMTTSAKPFRHPG